MIVREERPGDLPGIREVNELAFGQPAEADVVDKIRNRHGGLLSLVAVEGERVVGHALFSPAYIGGSDQDGRAVAGMGLAPVAVLPGFQGRGAGSALIRAGIDRLRAEGCPFIIVLGHPGYYPRFGFELASRHGIRSQWDVPDEAFMLLVLEPGALAGVSGVGRYLDEFDEAM